MCSQTHQRRMTGRCAGASNIGRVKRRCSPSLSTSPTVAPRPLCITHEAVLVFVRSPPLVTCCTCSARATSYSQPLDTVHLRGFKAEVAQCSSQALAADLLRDADVRGMMRKLPTVRSKLVALVDMALLNMDVRGTRPKRTWAHLLGSDDDVAACVAEACALHDAGNLWGRCCRSPR